MRYVWSLNEVRVWRCPRCGRDILMSSDKTQVWCSGGWKSGTNPPEPLHEITGCRLVGGAELADPIALADWTNATEWSRHVWLWQPYPWEVNGEAGYGYRFPVSEVPGRRLEG